MEAEQGLRWKRIGREWHRLDATIGGRRMTFFGITLAEVMAKAAAEERRERLRGIADAGQAAELAFADARAG